MNMHRHSSISTSSAFPLLNRKITPRTLNWEEYARMCVLFYIASLLKSSDNHTSLEVRMLTAVSPN